MCDKGPLPGLKLKMTVTEQKYPSNFLPRNRDFVNSTYKQGRAATHTI
jgi:hypothetical protein